MNENQINVNYANNKKGSTLVIVIFSIMLVGFTFIYFTLILPPMSSIASTEAVVTASEPCTCTSSGKKHKTSKGYRDHYEFKYGDQSYTGYVDCSCGAFSSPSVGKKFQVVYDRNNPDHNMKMTTVVLIGAVLMFMYIVYILVILGTLNRRKENELNNTDNDMNIYSDIK